MSKKLPFASESFVCLDVPEPYAGKVMDVRQRHRDEFRSSLPAEITVAGSSGVGVIEEGEDPQKVRRILDEIAESTSPIRASFGPVLRFDGTDIFVLTLNDAAPVEALHNRIADSEIRFKATPHQFFPHCTLRSRGPVTEEEALDLFGLRIEGEFALSDLVVYVLDKLPMSEMYRGELVGNSGAH